MLLPSSWRVSIWDRDQLSDQQELQQAIRAVDIAARDCVLSMIRKQLKDRAKRNPLDSRVQEEFRTWVLSGKFISFFITRALPVLSDIEQHMGKPQAAWTIKERIDACRMLAASFNALRSSYERGPGAPRKSHGIIADVRRPVVEEIKLQRRTDKDAEIAEYLDYERGAKLGAFALAEYKQYLGEGCSEAQTYALLGTVKAALAYMVNADAEDEVRNRRAPKGTLDGFCESRGVPLAEREAFKARVKRARKKAK